MIAAMIRPISRTFLINRPTMKPMTKGRIAAMMKVVERSGGKIATKGSYHAPRSYEGIHEDAARLSLAVNLPSDVVIQKRRTDHSIIGTPIPRYESMVFPSKRFIRLSASGLCCGTGTR